MDAARGKRTTNGPAEELRAVDANLEDLVEGAATTVYSEACRKSQRLVINIDAEAAMVTADPSKLKRVLADLLFNAVWHTPVAGKVTVEARREESEYVIAVSDGGEGVPPGEAPHLFERPATVEAGAPSERTGLDLSVVKELVKQHGGRVWAESRPGRGTTIFVSLPQPVSRAAPETRQAAPPRYGRASHG
jgi:NtrC-family two-component system sensor histidine kinase KinB